MPKTQTAKKRLPRKVSPRRASHPVPGLIGSLLQFDLERETDQLRQEDPWNTTSRNAETLVKYADLRIVLIAMTSGSRMEGHKADGSISIQGLTGNLRLHLYRAVRFEERVQEMDVVFDIVETLQRAWGVLKRRGRMITIAADEGEPTDDRVKQAFFIVEPNQKQLTEIGDLLEARHLQPVVDAVLPLEEASTAYTGEVRQRHGRGKLVVAVAAQGSAAAKG